jgi:hypothetical protein
MPFSISISGCRQCLLACVGRYLTVRNNIPGTLISASICVIIAVVPIRGTKTDTLIRSIQNDEAKIPVHRSTSHVRSRSNRFHHSISEPYHITYTIGKRTTRIHR